jgi:aminoglycoside phosphotransferase family enzyme/predicted kinase
LTRREILSLAEKIGAKKICETHTSWVLLTGRFAYKIKEPVNFGFLDYTSQKKRKRFCLEELRLNRRLSPEIYLDVLGITQDQRFVPKDSPQAIDYAVKMKELPQESLMSSILKKGKVLPSSVKEIARIIADFHNRVRQTKRTERYGSLKIVRFNWEENFSQTKDFIGKTISLSRYQMIKENINRFLSEKKDLFEQRIREKRIKFCHGDLHSGNIFLTDDKPDGKARKVYIFDCIEFNPRFACSDTASEVAFFLMDLEFHNRTDLADYFLDTYLQLTKDFTLLSLLTFYKCYRAYVRGKVSSFKMVEEGIEEKEKADAFKLARRYFLRSERYARSLFGAKKVFIFFGPPGSGKTFLAERFRKRKEGILLATDVLRKDLLSIPVEKHLPAEFGKGIYRKEITRRTYLTMIKRAQVYYAQKVNVLLDGTFANPDYRRLVKRALGSNNLIWIFCWAPKRMILERLKRERKYSDAHPEIYLRMAKRFRSLKDLGKVIRLNTRLKPEDNLRRLELESKGER